MKRVCTLLTVALAIPALAAAQAKPYLGGSIGASFYDTSVEDVTGENFKLDGEEFAWKVFGGVRTRSLLSVEGGYVHFGKIQNSQNLVAVESNHRA